MDHSKMMEEYYERAREMANQTRDFERGFDFIRNIKLNGKQVDESLRYKSILLGGRLLKVSGYYSAAVEHFHECLKFDTKGDEDVINANLGLLHYLKKNWNSSQNYFANAFEASENNSAVYAACMAELHGRAHLKDRENTDLEAFLSFSEEARKDKNYLRAYGSAAKMNCLLGRIHEYIQNVNHFVENDSDHTLISETRAFTGELNMKSKLVLAELKQVNDFFEDNKLYTGHDRVRFLSRRS